MIGTYILNNYAIEPVKTAAQYAKNHFADQMLMAAQYARDNPISAAIHNTAETSLEHLKSAANFAASFGFGNPYELEHMVHRGNDTGAGASWVPVGIVVAGGTFLMAAGIIASRYLFKVLARATIIRFRDSMEERWERWASREYESRHPLRRLDGHPYNWEPAIKSAIELGKEEEFTELVRRYRAEVGTKYLRDRTAVRLTIRDGNLEAIITGATQTAPYDY